MVQNVPEELNNCFTILADLCAELIKIQEMKKIFLRRNLTFKYKEVKKHLQ